MKNFVKLLENVVMKRYYLKIDFFRNFKVYFTCFLLGCLSLKLSYSASKK